MILDLGKSKFIDMRDCGSAPFKEIYQEMARIFEQTQPPWLRPALRWKKVRSRLSGCAPYGTRTWEYPWAVLNADLQSDMRVLDAGCGGSPFLGYLARRGFECFGVDAVRHESIRAIGVFRFIRRRLLEVTGVNMAIGYHDLAKRLNVSVAYKEEPIEQLSFEDNFFDRVFCLSVIEHIPKTHWLACVRQLVRVLRSGGRLIVTMDMSSGDVCSYKDVLYCCGVEESADVDHSIPPDCRHPDWTYETVGLVMIKS